MFKHLIVFCLLTILIVFFSFNNCYSFDGKNAAWSLLFPGLGQWCQDRVGAGWIYFGLGIVTLGPGIAFHFLSSGTYCFAIDTNEPSRYRDYLSFKKASELSFIGYGITVISSFLNAAFFENNSSITIEANKSNTKILFNKKL